MQKLSDMPVFRQAIKDNREGKQVLEPKIKVEPLWVKKKVAVKDWKNFYSFDSSYCFLGKESDGVEVGFMVANPKIKGVSQYSIGACPDTCVLLSDDEALRVDYYRRARNIAPYPAN